MALSKLTRREWLQAAAASPLLAATTPLAPYGALPSARQLAWSTLEYYNFLHFTVNTFTDREWGNGDEDPAIFNPTHFDADAICEALNASGSKGVILTCKHHDGFCLWPTKTTDHSIARSPYRKGKGDIVKEVSQAAARHGMKFGVYLSPWDRNQATYGKPEYIQLYRRQLRELLTNYGPLFEIWHDGANGGSGYYGGARETRTIDKTHYYDWARTWQLEAELQPGACRFSDVGPDIRWVGNEKGIAGDPCWATFTPVSPNGGKAMPGDVDEKQSNSGTRDGKFWMPAECDVSIRPGWFWHAKENDKVKSAEQLVDLYFDSVGRGASLLLNVPPDRRGLIHEADAASLKAFGQLRSKIFSNDFAAGATGAPQLVDGKANTYWTSPEATLTLKQKARFGIVRLREAIALGQRVSAFALDAWAENRWIEFIKGTSIGMASILSLPGHVTTDKVRLRITSPVPPAITELSLF
jgi:alpha-L-fucosidase